MCVCASENFYYNFRIYISEHLHLRTHRGSKGAGDLPKAREETNYLSFSKIMKVIFIIF